MTFEEIYQQFGQRTLNLVFKICGRADVARDLTQDIFLKVYQNLSGFDNKSQIYTWIYRIAVNHTLNYLKKEKRQRFIFKSDTATEYSEEPDLISTIADESAENSQELLEQKEKERIVRKMIKSLPEKYRIPLILQRYENLNNKEIAETLGISLSAAETRIHRAKKELVNKLEPWLEKI